MSANHPSYDARRRYYARVRWATVVAVAVHGIAFAAAPPYAPKPAETRTSPLRLVTVSGTWGAGTANAGSNTATPPPQARSVSQVGATIGESRVTTEPAAVAVPSAPAGATNRGGAGLQPGTLEGSAALEDESPPVFYDFDTPPLAIRRVEPEYPAAARVRDEEGTVVVNVNIDERGRILRAWVAAKDGSEYLVAAALDAAYQFEFTPGKQRNIPVKCTVAIPFRFRLRDNG